MVNVDRSVESFHMIAKVKKGDSLGPDLQELAGPREAHYTRRSPDNGSEDKTRLTMPPPPSSRMQEPAGTDDSASGWPQNLKSHPSNADKQRSQAPQPTPKLLHIH